MERMQKAYPGVFRLRNEDVDRNALATIATRIRGGDMDGRRLGNVTTAEGVTSTDVTPEAVLDTQRTTRTWLRNNDDRRRAARDRNTAGRARVQVRRDAGEENVEDFEDEDLPPEESLEANYKSMRFLTQYSRGFTTTLEPIRTPFHTFENKIRKWIGDDIIRFNRRRMRILSYIESWARRQGAYGLILDLEKAEDDGKAFSDLLMADYQLTGDVSCPSGTGTIWYEYDPAKAHENGNKPPKIVPRIIKTWDGKEVVNPKATFPLCAQTMESFKGYAGPPPPMSDPYPAYRAPPRPVSAPSPAYAYAPSPYIGRPPAYCRPACGHAASRHAGEPGPEPADSGEGRGEERGEEGGLPFPAGGAGGQPHRHRLDALDRELFSDTSV
eukprot:jgi/Mesvir1/18801/Mv01307-RA.1